MPHNPNTHHRKSIRLKGYDYSQAGLYFITICAQDRLCLFGNIENGEMTLNDAGSIANECWLNIPKHFPNVVLHEHIVMPNHVHGIIELVGANHHSPVNHAHDNGAKNVSHDNGAKNVSHDNGAKNVSHDNGAKNVSPLRSPSKTIGSIVRGYKIGVTKWFRSNENMENIWQRNYWEHIIRDEQSYHRIVKYIINNPKNWKKGKLDFQ
jgi:REP element-mobilizing transposase RayT